MKITAPFGYDRIVPLQKTHRVLMPAGATPAFCRRLNALAISLAEFTVAARDYPIVFATLDGGKSFAPVILHAPGGASQASWRYRFISIPAVAPQMVRSSNFIS